MLCLPRTRYRALLLPLPLFALTPLAHAQTKLTAPEFAYASRGDASAFHLYRMEANGRFTALAPAVITYSDIVDSMATDPKGRYLYVACRGEGIRQYKIKPDGSLAPPSPAVVAIPPKKRDFDPFSGTTEASTVRVTRGK